MVDFDVFTEFHAVVLEHRGRGPLRWSTTHEAWVRRAGNDWADSPVDGDRVHEHQETAALDVAASFLGRHFCRRCEGSRLDLHFIAINVIGAPEVYCLTWPAFDVVDSAGGNGYLKHWGSPFSCHAVGGPALNSANVPGAGYSVVAGFVYGHPLLPDEAMKRAWCLRCRTAAGRVLDERPRDGDEDSSRGARLSLARLIDGAID